MRQPERTIEEIEAEMARSRAEIEKTSEALKESVSSEHLAEAARHVLLEGTVRVEEKVKELAGSAGDQVETLGSLAVEAIRRNPVPALLAGIGLGLLVSLADRDGREALTEPVLSGSNATTLPRQTSAPQRAMREVRRANLHHPLLAGAAIFGVGLLLGSLIPATEREDDLMGPYRDRLLAEGKESAQQALNQAKCAIHSEVDKHLSEVAEVKDGMEAAALKAFHHARTHDSSDLHEPGQI